MLKRANFTFLCFSVLNQCLSFVPSILCCLTFHIFCTTCEMPTRLGVRINNGVRTTRQLDERQKPTQPGVWIVSYQVFLFNINNLMGNEGAFSRSPELDPHHQMHFRVILRTRLFGERWSYLSAGDKVSVF